MALMNLTVDIGNTFVKMCVFSGDDVVWVGAQREFSRDDVGDLVERWGVEGAIISTVSNNNMELKTLLIERGVDVVEMDGGVALPIRVEYDTPRTLGQDRVAAAVGANWMFPNEELVVVDMGTCNTYDFVGADGVFRGGNIAPGYKMRLDAMCHFTRRLPEVDVTERVLPRIGDSTESAMNAGAYYGIVSELRCLIADHKGKWGSDAKVVVTGGAVRFFEKDLEGCVIEPCLVHIGLNRILRLVEKFKV